jgi:hypothetical protein
MSEGKDRHRGENPDIRSFSKLTMEGDNHPSKRALFYPGEEALSSVRRRRDGAYDSARNGLGIALPARGRYRAIRHFYTRDSRIYLSRRLQACVLSGHRVYLEIFF